MLPVCSATTSFPSHSQISLHGGSLTLHHKALEARHFMEERMVMGLYHGNPGVSCKAKAVVHYHSGFVGSTEQSESMAFVNVSPYTNELDTIRCNFSDHCNYSMGTGNKLHSIGRSYLKFVEFSDGSAGEEELMGFTGQLKESTDVVLEAADTQTLINNDLIPDYLDSVSKTLDMDNNLSSSVEDTFSGVNESINASVQKGQSALQDSIDTITTTITSALKGVNEAVDNAIGKVTASFDQTGELATNKLTAFSNDLKEASSKVGTVTIDSLRSAIVMVEDSLAQGANSIVRAYESAKNMLPSGAQIVLNSSEERTVTILRPVGTAFQQISIALEVLERSLGLDPRDPIVPFAIFLGASVTLWGSYWLFTYGGYAGDLSPKLTLELLSGNENVALIDVRPEDLRERDGVPDLRRAARFRYANVILPEVDGSVQKLTRSGKDLDDSLTAAVIRNLKIVQDRSKVIVMDADGNRSKGIARSLRKLGVKRAYLVQGGFQSWVSQGLRVKELKPETALTILNEEAEAILEDIKPTPVQVLGYGVGFIAAVYAALEWETALQLIGVIGLVQTIYWRVASYEDAEDFRKDVRLLLAPVRLGGQAISWAAGKLETNGIGLPTSPSSSDVQNRVLQAAAKHESQPSDGKENQASSTDLSAVNESVDLSEA